MVEHAPSGSDVRALRARAHKLRPVVQVGAAGITPSLVAETSRALEHHELIKVRFAEEDRNAFRDAARELAGQLGAEVIQLVGRIAVLHRAREE
jgi:RNA-binding protein